MCVPTSFVAILLLLLSAKHTNEFKHQTLPLMGATRPEAAEKCPTRDASPPLERNVLVQQFFPWLQIRF